MKSQPVNHLTLTGEVIEIYEVKGTHQVKIMCKPEFIMLYANKLEQLRLGEEVVIEGDFMIKTLYEV
ncbi:MAG: hypothetical protein P1P88_06365 [Bacteroidales bacterium]|nr:hypothetical protein [Bacteroidales bacterium]